MIENVPGIGIRLKDVYSDVIFRLMQKHIESMIYRSRSCQRRVAIGFSRLTGFA
jgi:hypothetical protein